MYAGGGVIASGATGAVVRLVETLQAPIIVSANGKGSIPEDHPLFLGGGWGAHAMGREALERADVVLAVGARFGPLPTSYWNQRIPGQLIHVDVDPSETGKHYRATVGIVADAGRAMTAIGEAVKADQEVNYGGRTIGTDLRSPDFARLAEAFGARGHQVERLADVPRAVADAIARGAPTVIETPIQQVVPPVDSLATSQQRVRRPGTHLAMTMCQTRVAPRAVDTRSFQSVPSNTRGP